MAIEDLKKEYKELQKKSGKYYYSDVQEFARRIENFYYSNKAKYKEISQLLFELYKNELPKFIDEDYGHKSTKDELIRIFLEITGFGIKKEIDIQKYFLGVLKQYVNNKTLIELVITILDKYFILQGTETSLDEDSKSIGIKSFYVNLNPTVREIRKQTLQNLFSITKNDSENYEQVKSVVLSIKSNIHSLAVVLQNDKSEEGQNIVKSEIIESLKSLESIKNLYNGSRVEHLNIFHEISLSIWDPYEDDWEIRNINEAIVLKKSIWSNENYLLFKAILRPGYNFSNSILQIVEDFSEDNIGLLEEIIQFAENEKSIYNSIKTFFFYLGQTKVFDKIFEVAQSNNNSPLWYYIGFGFSNLEKALIFSETVNPDNIVKIKAKFDALYHVGYKPDNTETDWKNQSRNKRLQSYHFLSEQIKLGAELIIEDPREIFWWNNSIIQILRHLTPRLFYYNQYFDLYLQHIGTVLTIDKKSGVYINEIFTSLNFLDKEIRDRLFSKVRSEIFLSKIKQPIKFGYEIKALLQNIAYQHPILVEKFLVNYANKYFASNKLPIINYDPEELNFIFTKCDDDQKKQVFTHFLKKFASIYAQKNNAYFKTSWLERSLKELSSLLAYSSFLEISQNQFGTNKISRIGGRSDSEKSQRLILCIKSLFEYDFTQTERKAKVFDLLKNIKSTPMLMLVTSCPDLSVYITNDYFSRIDNIVARVEASAMKNDDNGYLVLKKKILDIATHHQYYERRYQFFDLAVEILAFDWASREYKNVKFLDDIHSKDKTPDLIADDGVFKVLIECKHINRPREEDLTLSTGGTLVSFLDEGSEGKALLEKTAGIFKSTNKKFMEYLKKNNSGIISELILYTKFDPSIYSKKNRLNDYDEDNYLNKAKEENSLIHHEYEDE